MSEPAEEATQKQHEGAVEGAPSEAQPKTAETPAEDTAAGESETAGDKGVEETTSAVESEEVAPEIPGESDAATTEAEAAGAGTSAPEDEAPVGDDAKGEGDEPEKSGDDETQPEENQPNEPADTSDEKTRLVAIGDVGIHVLAGEQPEEGSLAIVSIVLLPGESVGVDEVAPYILEAVVSGEEKRLFLATEFEAAEAKQKVAVGAPLVDPGIVTESHSTPDGEPILGEDGTPLVTFEGGSPVFHSK